jgi:predicted extracellular nuclease
MMGKNISFASFNLYNLQLPGVTWRHNAQPYTQEAYDAKVEWSARMLERLDADVIGFQELWSKQCLIDVFNAAKLMNDYELIFIKDKWYDIAVAAAVRKPWAVNMTLHKNFPEAFALIKRGQRTPGEDDDIQVAIDKFSRTVMQLSITHPDDDKVPQMEVFTAHLKSKLATKLDKPERDTAALKDHQRALGDAISTIRRTAESAALRMILVKVLKKTNTPVVVIGDLNDNQHSNTLAILTGQPSYRMSQASRRGSKSDIGLYTAGTLQELGSLRDVYYTHQYEGVRETLDHILVSEQFYGFSKNRKWVFDEMKIWNDHIEDGDKATSDHGVVGAYFKWG